MTRPLLSLVVILLAGPAAAWPDTYVGRLQALALIQSLRADLLSHDSATEVLTTWCADHHLADPPRIVARRFRVDAAPPSAETRGLLGVGASEPIAYRRVELVCGVHVLAQADNWYVPSRLTPNMNRLLETTDTPFGAVVQPLDFHRRTLQSSLLFRPLPENWEMRAATARGRRSTLALPDTLLRHRAILATPNGVPFSLVVEDYRRELLAFEPVRKH